MMRAFIKICIVVLLSGLSATTPATADEIRPALLDIKQQNTGLFAVTWKVPTRGDKVLAITPQLPDSLELVGTPTVQQAPGAQIEHATYKSNADSLTGQMIVIDGLTAVQTDVLLLIQLRDGTQHSAILRPSSPQFTIPLEASKLAVAADYWRLGTIHILEGVDHLLFVLALLLIVVGFKDQQRAPFQVLFDHGGCNAKIGGNSDFCSVLIDRKPAWIFGIMGYGKGMDGQVIDCEH